MKNQKGITLIALIITIIVMLILVAVAVTAVVNSGLFKHAGAAKEGWEKSQEAENNIDQGISDGNGHQGINGIVEQY